MSKSKSPSSRKKEPLTGRQRSFVIGIDRFVYWLSKHWLGVFNGVAAIYVGLPILAPVLMHWGVTGPAKAIYVAYSPMCHQMATRSFFLFGEQYAYPRELAGTDLIPLENYAADLPEFANAPASNWTTFFAAARVFIGNEQMGYKMALCERDIGIYGFVFLGGVIYGFLRKRMKVKPLPLFAFVILGMGPIGLDGFSQLFAYMAIPAAGEPSAFQTFLQGFFPLRESFPLLRTLTGIWFGLTLVWLAYPHVDAGMKDSERDLGEKLKRAGVL